MSFLVLSPVLDSWITISEGGLLHYLGSELKRKEPSSIYKAFSEANLGKVKDIGRFMNLNLRVLLLKISNGFGEIVTFKLANGSVKMSWVQSRHCGRSCRFVGSNNVLSSGWTQVRSYPRCPLAAVRRSLNRLET
jgi:hypothetical protein